MTKKTLWTSVTALIVGCLSSSCSSVDDVVPQKENASATFTIGLDVRTRAAQSLNLANYDAKMYLYEGYEEKNGTVGYSLKKEVNITDNRLTINDLVSKTKYKAVFLAVPKGQEPALPEYGTMEIAPSYITSTAKYINGNETETDKNIFRSILSFTASPSAGSQSTVLTRQNGALEVRIKNVPNMASVKLHVKGYTTMYLNDGTGGQVITEGQPVVLSKTVTEGLTASEVRVKINLLPQEDIADASGNDNYLEIVTNDGKSQKYPIKSDHEMIPIYPNQVTWLTLGSGSGNFDVNFSGKIHLEDDNWDGWNDDFEESLPDASGSAPKGQFRARFFPQQANVDNVQTRSAVNGNSTQIQSLVCLIYQKQLDGTYKYYTEKQVLTYEGTTGAIDAQTYEWPLKQEVSFDFPNGDYKAIFVGNVDKRLFADQKDNEILTSYKGDMASARINMPELGPLGFNQYNMFYLCTVDFSAANPSPTVLMQRVMSNNVYGRDMIDDNTAVQMLVNNLVKQIRENNLTTEVVQALLHSTLLDALSKATGLEAIAGGLTTVVDRLVNMLLGDVLEMLNEQLLKEVTTRLQAALKGEGGPSKSLLGLNYILNPWTTAEAVDITYSSLPKSIDFNRNCRSFYPATAWVNIPVSHTNNLGTCSVVSLCGEGKLKEININKNSKGYTQLLAPILNTLDDKVLDGLLVNIHAPLCYEQQSNLQYSTTYELLNLTLSDFKEDSTGEPLELNIQLKDIVNIEQLVKSLLGDNVLTQIVGGLTDKLLQPLIDALNTVVIKPLNIRLPGLNLNNIVLEGSWDATHVSDGTIAPLLM